MLIGTSVRPQSRLEIMSQTRSTYNQVLKGGEGGPRNELLAPLTRLNMSEVAGNKVK